MVFCTFDDLQMSQSGGDKRDARMKEMKAYIRMCACVYVPIYKHTYRKGRDRDRRKMVSDEMIRCV